MIKKFVKIFLIIDLGVVAFCLLQGNMAWLINTQIAFLSSAAITVGSFLGYQRNIKSRVFKENQKYNEQDSIDKIEDPFDLYSEDEINEEKELSEQEIKEIIKEEKSKVKQKSFKNMFLSFGGFSSFYRIAGYVMLIAGFFYLVNNKLFDTYAYLFGLFIVPLGTLIINFTLRSKEG